MKTHAIDIQTSPAFQEADLLEEWALETGAESADEVLAAWHDCDIWLNDPALTFSRREQLKEPQSRSSIRAQMRAHLKGRHPSR